MSGSWMALAVALATGILAMGATMRWLVTDRDQRWVTNYRRYGPVDQRLALPIAIAVDTLFAAVLAAEGAGAGFWLAFAAVVAVQAAYAAIVLTVVRWWNGMRRTPP